MDQNKPVAEIIGDQIRSYSSATQEIRDGWSIETTTYRTCLTCLVDGGEDADMGTTINKQDKMVQLSHYIVVDDDQCDYLTEHEVVEQDEELDRTIQAALDSAVEKGLVVKTVGPDGETLYQHVK